MAKQHDGDDGQEEADRREHARYDTSLQVDWSSGENFLFSYIENISAMGIFLRSDDPAPVGTQLVLRFADGNGKSLELAGEVCWINPLRPEGDNLNPGMGVRFTGLTAEQRERVVGLVRTIAYLQDDAEN